MDIYIDTANTNQTIIKIINNSGEEVVNQSNLGVGSDTLLPHLSQILSCIPINKLKRVFVNTGPGSFTGTRVGVSVANAIGFCLGLPVNNSRDSYAKVKYEKSKFS